MPGATFYNSGIKVQTVMKERCGYLYFWGIEEQEKLYVSVSQIPGNADGSYTYEVYVYSMVEGRKEKLHKFSLEGSLLKFSYHHRSYEVKLQQG
ncbi:hypothetical protein D3C75_1097780 [compost metagenome]